MEKEKLVQFMQQTGLVSFDNAMQIADKFSEQTILKNNLFLAAGKISNEYLFLENGFMRSFALDTNGNEITTSFSASNAVVFEVSSFFNRTPSKENIQALTDCNGWRITYNELNELFHGMPAFREFGRHILVRGFAALKNRMLSTITETAEERYENLVKSNPEIFQFAALKHIASYLGITDTSLSRIRKEFSKK